MTSVRQRLVCITVYTGSRRERRKKGKERKGEETKEKKGCNMREHTAKEGTDCLAQNRSDSHHY